MRQRKKMLLNVFVMLFFVCLLLCETIYYQFECGTFAFSAVRTESEIGSTETILTLMEHVLPRPTLNSRTTLAYLERNMPDRVRFESMILFLIALASFLIETKKGQQEYSLCRFQTFFQSILNILHRRDGKKDDFFLYCYS